MTGVTISGGLYTGIANGHSSSLCLVAIVFVRVSSCVYTYMICRLKYFFSNSYREKKFNNIIATNTDQK